MASQIAGIHKALEGSRRQRMSRANSHRANAKLASNANVGNISRSRSERGQLRGNTQVAILCEGYSQGFDVS